MQSEQIFLIFFFYCTILSFGKPMEYLEDSSEAGVEYDTTYIYHLCVILIHNINTLFLLDIIAAFRKTTPCRVGFFTKVKNSCKKPLRQG